MTPCWWKLKRMTFGFVASTCGLASAGCSPPSMPTRCPVLPRTCWVRPPPATADFLLYHPLTWVRVTSPPPPPRPLPREQAEPLLGGALRRAVLGLRGSTVSPGQWHPVCRHAKGQCGDGGRHRLEAHLDVTPAPRGGIAPVAPRPPASKGDVTGLALGPDSEA